MPRTDPGPNVGCPPDPSGRRHPHRADRGRPALFALVLLLLLCASAAWAGEGDAEGAEGTRAAETHKSWSNGDGSISLRLPADWSAEVLPQKEFLFRLRVTVLGHPFVLRVFLLAGARHARSQVFIELPVQLDRYDVKDGDSETGIDPLPHLSFIWNRRGTKTRAMFACVTRHRQCLSISTDSIVETAWPRLREQVLAAANSLESKLPEPLVRPEGYSSKSVGGVLFLAHPDVPLNGRAAVRKQVTAQRKKYESRHGPLPIDPDNVPIVVIHATTGDARSVNLKASKATGGQWFDYETQCLFTVPPAAGSATDRALLAYETEQFLHNETYGLHAASWLERGEAAAAKSHKSCGKPFPRLVDTFGPLPESMPNLEYQLKGSKESVYWVLFLRHGPSDVRRAFTAFLREMRRTGDWEGAVKTHLLSLDQDELRKSAEQFIRKRVKLVEAR